MNTLRLILIGLVLGALGLTGGIGSTKSSALPSAVPLAQFTSQGHVLGFQRDGFWLSNARYALKVEFVGANSVAPISTGSTQLKNDAVLPLAEVTYPELWEGITLAYDAPQGSILRSTYTVAPGAPVEQIRLRYNAPVTLNSDGSLGVTYPMGLVSETAPVAWQEIGGERQPVAVAFVSHGEREVGFAVGAHDPQIALTIDPVMTWNTFLGGKGSDYGNGIAVDGNGNVYVAGASRGTSSAYSWGAGECTGCPIRAYNGGLDAFAAKLDSNGTLMWNTFLGGLEGDSASSIAVDGNGNVMVSGVSGEGWGYGECSGCPLRPHTATGANPFAAKLNANGALVWNTFLGEANSDSNSKIVVDETGNVYVAGGSISAWGTPVHPFNWCPPTDDSCDAFAAKLDPDGALVWNTFLGGTSYDDGSGIAVDGTGNVYVVGGSAATWGTPVHPCSSTPGDSCGAFAAKLNSNGALTWNTFLSGSGVDTATAIAVDGSGNVYVAGDSRATWGTPVRPYTPGPNSNLWRDGFAAKLISNGTLTWNTFLGGGKYDTATGVAVDGSGNVYVSAASESTWGAGECPGCPIRPYSSGRDAAAVRLDSNGALRWNTFLGGAAYDIGYGISVESSGNVYVMGDSVATWGTPIRAYTPESEPWQSGDAFVVKIPAVTSCAEKPDKPSLIKPSDQQQKKGPKVKLDWSDTACATRYTIVVKEGSKKGPIAFKEVGWTNSLIRTTPLSSGVSYYWQVVAKNGFGKNKSVWYSFTMK